MKTLLIMRHAKSSWSDSSLSDHERPLNKRGQHDAPIMGALLLDENLTPDLIMSSSARRAVETSEAVANASDYEGRIVVTRELYHADPDIYFSVVRDFGANNETLMIVGHNPGIEELIEQLSGDWYRMPTAALAEMRLDLNTWRDLGEDAEGTLANLWLPRELPGSRR